MYTEDMFGDTTFGLFDDEPTHTQQPNKIVKKKKKKAKKEDFKNSMANAPQSPFKCKSHTTQNLRLRRVEKNPPLCKSCGFKCEGVNGFLTCPESISCFFLCSACKVCPQNHILRHCVSLKHYDHDALFAENRFKCSSCEKTKDVAPKGAYHCAPCNFSLCMECLEELDELWDSDWKNKEKELQAVEEKEEE